MKQLFNETNLRESLGSRPFRFFAQVGSTNDLAREWAQQHGPTGAVVLTEEQVTGRGRFGREWTAPPGTALLMSIILRPHVSADHLPRLTMVGATAVAHVLEELVPEMVSLKWPNDVLLGGRKVAGILPEAVWQGNHLEAVILGIGLNVSVDFTGTDLMQRATSIEQAVGTAVDRLALLNKILHHIDYWSMRVNETQLLTAWRNWLNTLGKRVTATGESGVIVGVAVDVGDDGSLILRSDDGTLHRVVSGEVTLSA